MVTSNRPPVLCQVSWGLNRLYGVGGEHLLTEVVLVLSNRTVPSGGGLVLTDHDVLGNLVEKSEKRISKE